MRHILLALLAGVGLAACAQALKAQPSTDLVGLVGVAGHHMANDELTRSRRVCRNLTSITGIVISPKIIQTHGIVCGDPMGSNPQTLGDYLATDEISRDGFRNVQSARRGDIPTVTMNVNLARPEDAQKMLPGEVVTLSGYFSLMTTNLGY